MVMVGVTIDGPWCLVIGMLSVMLLAKTIFCISFSNRFFTLCDYDGVEGTTYTWWQWFHEVCIHLAQAGQGSLGGSNSSFPMQKILFFIRFSNVCCSWSLIRFSSYCLSIVIFEQAEQGSLGKAATQPCLFLYDAAVDQCPSQSHIQVDNQINIIWRCCRVSSVDQYLWQSHIQLITKLTSTMFEGNQAFRSQSQS